MAKTTTYEDQVLDAKVDRIVSTLKRLLLVFFTTVLVAIAIVFVLELKREFQIDVFQGINFTIDDWYFDKVGAIK